MMKLLNEYTDIGNVRHKVEHTVLPEKDNYSRERILEELMLALTKKYDKIHKPT
ncbi:MAG: hypothetical protein J5999_09365 [Oscillospiraceae bacterium]|nr:hypothetical protein [Oscillospiraceae bacterium]